MIWKICLNCKNWLQHLTKGVVNEKVIRNGDFFYFLIHPYFRLRFCQNHQRCGGLAHQHPTWRQLDFLFIRLFWRGWPGAIPEIWDFGRISRAMFWFSTLNLYVWLFKIQRDSHRLCSARLEKIDFYTRFGMQKTGSSYEKNQKQYIRMELTF